MGKTLFVVLLLVILPISPSQASTHSSSLENYRKANSLFGSGRFQEAISLYQKVLISLPDGVHPGAVHSRIADSFVRLGSFSNALEEYRAALREQRESEKPETQYWIGFCCFLLGKDADAVAEFLKVPEFYPHSGIWVGTAYYWAGRASERMGRAGEAAAYYKKAAGSGKSTQGRFALKKAQAVNKTSTKSQAPNSR